MEVNTQNVATFTAGEDLSAAEGLIVKMGTADNTVVKCTAGVAAIGVVIDGDQAVNGGQVSVQHGGIVRIKSGAAIAARGLVECDANGKAITRAAGIVVGKNLETAGGADEEIRVLLHCEPL